MTTHWYLWFAWKPVRLLDGSRAWLCLVRRRDWKGVDGTVYSDYRKWVRRVPNPSLQR